jgi:hypothetical protein
MVQCPDAKLFRSIITAYDGGGLDLCSSRLSQQDIDFTGDASSGHNTKTRYQDKEYINLDEGAVRRVPIFAILHRTVAVPASLLKGI